MSAREEWLIDKRVAVRRDDDGGFDELLVYDDAGECILHAEMMSDTQLWMGVYPPHCNDRAVRMSISARGKLKIFAEED